MGVLAALIAPLAFTLLSAERSTAVGNELEAIYRAIAGNPASLVDLLEKPTTPGLLGWRGPYLNEPVLNQGLLTDPFGNPYELFLVNNPDIISGGTVTHVDDDLAIISRGENRISTNTASNPNVAANFTGTAPTVTTYLIDGGSVNADNVLFPQRSSTDPGNSFKVNIFGSVTYNVTVFDSNKDVNGVVPLCANFADATFTPVARGSGDAENP